MIPLQPKNHAGKQTHNQDDRHTHGALLVNGGKNPPHESFGLRQSTKSPCGKKREIAYTLNNSQCLTTEPIKHGMGQCQNDEDFTIRSFALFQDPCPLSRVPQITKSQQAIRPYMESRNCF